jgi:hypothetical protein
VDAVNPLDSLKELVGDSTAEVFSEALTKAFEHGVQSARQFPKVEIYRWVCPVCNGAGRWESGERCLHCHGNGLTNDIGGWSPEECTPAPRPPAVMARPCTDCAFRPGSPEDESSMTIKLPGPDEPFFCHHGLHRIGDGYVGTATMGELPLGAMLCAGWWATANGESRPEKPFRDPGGNDRRADVPQSVSDREA